MEELLRTRVGHFRIEDSVRLSELERYREEGTLEEHLIPVDSVFADCPRLDVPERLEPLLYNGNPLRLPEGEDGQLVRVYDSRGRFIALYRYQQKKHIYKNEKMFFSP